MNANATLTRRQGEVAEYIAWGATKKDIANVLNRSIRTIENIARSVYIKTGTTKSNELSAWWFCTRFNISFDLSPLKRTMVAISLLMLFLAYDISPKTEWLSVARGRNQRIEEPRPLRRPREEENLLIAV